MKWGQRAVNLKRSEVCLPCLGLADALIKLFGMIKTTHLSHGLHLVWKLLLVCGKTFPQLLKWGRFAFVERHHLFWKLFRWNVKFKGKQHHWPRVSRFYAHGFPEIQLQQRQPIILLPLRLICHDEFTFCKDKDYHRQYKVKHKINRGFFASFFPYCSLFVRAWFMSPSDGQAADRSTNFFSCVHGSCLLRPCLLSFFSLLPIPSHRNLPTLCCSIRFPHSPFCFILVDEEGRKLAEGQANDWRLRLPWRRKTIVLVRLRTNFWGKRWGWLSCAGVETRGWECAKWGGKWGEKRWKI